MVNLEIHKPTNHTIADEGGGCCGIHGGIPYGIACATDVGAHDITCPAGGTRHSGGGSQCPRTD
jgi:hypothetical protein